MMTTTTLMIPVMRNPLSKLLMVTLQITTEWVCQLFFCVTFYSKLMLHFWIIFSFFKLNDLSIETNHQCATSMGKFVKLLTRIPDRKTTAEHLADLKSRRLASDAFTLAMEQPKKLCEGWTRTGKIDGCPIGVSRWATAAQVLALQAKIKTFKPDYSPEYRNKSHLHQMKNIKELFESPDHWQIMDFSFELQLCGKMKWGICQKIGRSVLTPNVSIRKYNLRQEMLWFTTMPVPNPLDPDHFLAPEANCAFIEQKKPSLDMLKSYIPNLKLNSEEAKAIANEKASDKAKDFHQSKVHGIIECDSCSAPRWFYSNNCVCSRDGPSKKQLEDLERKLENGYHCGNNIDQCGFYARRAIHCGDYIESQYFNPTKGIKGGRVETIDHCAICYADTHFVFYEEIRQCRDMKGKNPLIISWCCFDANINIPTSGGHTNFAHKSQQKNNNKRKQLETVVKGGHQKGRKSTK